MLDYRIYTFLKVCETLNYTLAAKQLHITQPAACFVTPLALK